MLSTLEDELNLVVSVFMCFRGFHNYFCMIFIPYFKYI